MAGEYKGSGFQKISIQSNELLPAYPVGVLLPLRPLRHFTFSITYPICKLLHQKNTLMCTSASAVIWATVWAICGWPLI